MKEASKRFGIVEHIVVSVPTKDYGMTDKCLRRKVRKMLFGLGVSGGVITVHDFREDDFGHWYFSRHFHVLGFIIGGYSRCRHCSGADCYKCNGFEGKCYKLYRENGYIVRVLGERKTIGGTAFYELTHASVKKGAKHFHVATWFGSCSYRKLKVSAEYREKVCPCVGTIWRDYVISVGGIGFLAKRGASFSLISRRMGLQRGSWTPVDMVEMDSGSYG